MFGSILLASMQSEYAYIYDRQTCTFLDLETIKRVDFKGLIRKKERKKRKQKKEKKERKGDGQLGRRASRNKTPLNFLSDLILLL